MAPEHRSVLAVDAQPQRYGVLPGHEGSAGRASGSQIHTAPRWDPHSSQSMRMASAVRLDSSPSERLSLTGPMSSRRASISRTSAQSTPHSGSNPPSTRAGSALCEARRTRRGQAGRAAMPSRSRIPPRQAPAAGATPDTAAFPWFAAAHRPVSHCRPAPPA